MKLLTASVVVASVFLFGCEPSTKHLVGGYSLERFDESGMYYVVDPEDAPGGGVFDGTVSQLGWNQEWIIAQVTRLSVGQSGWYALDVKSKRVYGPISESELHTNNAWSQIKFCIPESVIK